jgi:hypothetical protein
MKYTATLLLALSISLANTAPSFAFNDVYVQTQDQVERNGGAGYRCIWRGKKHKLNKRKCIW